MFRRWITGLFAITVVLGGLTACGGGERDELVVGATPVPHAEILTYVAQELAPAAGLRLTVKEFTDYIQPNMAIGAGIDANYFQHRPYLDEFTVKHQTKLASVVPVHIEPLGAYSKKFRSIAEIPVGAHVAIPSDVTNGGRALQLLAAHNLITLKEGASTEKDIVDNPKKLTFKALEAAQLPRSLEDVALAIINGNYAIEAGLNPATDALFVEEGKNNPYANILVTRQGRENDPKIQKLAALLNSPQVKKFIEDKYSGTVIPAF